VKTQIADSWQLTAGSNIKPAACCPLPATAEPAKP
jgi:hypothetical protein